MVPPRRSRVLAGAIAAAAVVAFPGCSQKEATMDEAIAALMAKPEQFNEVVTLQHVLIAFKGAERATVERSKEEAKLLAEKVWREAIAGADFKALMKAHSNDPGAGEYSITKAGRINWAQSFGDVGFRLQVGEIGVAPYDATKSKFGWHIIKRVK